MQLAYTRQLTDALGFRNVFSYRHLNELYFLSEEVDFIAPSTIDRYYLYFNHHWRPLAEPRRIDGAREPRRPAGAARRLGLRALPQLHHAAGGGLLSGGVDDAFNPVETQGPSDLTITRQNVATSYTNGFYVQDHLTLGPRSSCCSAAATTITGAPPAPTTSPAPVRCRVPVTESHTNAFTGRAGLV